MKLLSIFKLKDLMSRLPNPNNYEYDTYRIEMLPDIEYSVKLTRAPEVMMLPDAVVFHKERVGGLDKYGWALQL